MNKKKHFKINCYGFVYQKGEKKMEISVSYENNNYVDESVRGRSDFRP